MLLQFPCYTNLWVIKQIFLNGSCRLNCKIHLGVVWCNTHEDIYPIVHISQMSDNDYISVNDSWLTRTGGISGFSGFDIVLSGPAKREEEWTSKQTALPSKETWLHTYTACIHNTFTQESSTVSVNNLFSTCVYSLVSENFYNYHLWRTAYSSSHAFV